MNATATHDNTELKGMIDLLRAKVDAQTAATEADKAAKATDSTPPAKTPEPAEPVDITGIIGQIGKALNPPRTKRMAITAPSGAVYQGEMQDGVTDDE